MDMVRFCIALLTVLFMVAPVAADRVTHPVGLSIWIPDAWEIGGEGDTLEVADSEERVHMVFYVVSDKTADELLKQIGGELAKFVQAPIYRTRPRQSRINNVVGHIGDGSGVLDGAPVLWKMGVYAHKADVLVALAVMDFRDRGDFEPPVDKVLESVKAELGAAP